MAGVILTSDARITSVDVAVAPHEQEAGGATAPLPFLEQDEPVRSILSERRAVALGKLPELRSYLESSGSPHPAACSCQDDVLLRYLESTGGKVKQAASGLNATLKWRDKEGLNASPAPRACEKCEKDPYAHCIFSIGRDRRGWEVFYSCPGRSRAKDPTSGIRHMVLAFERAFEVPNPPSHFVLLVDLHGFGLADMDPSKCPSDEPAAC